MLEYEIGRSEILSQVNDDMVGFFYNKNLCVHCAVHQWLFDERGRFVTEPESADRKVPFRLKNRVFGSILKKVNKKEFHNLVVCGTINCYMALPFKDQSPRDGM